MVVPLIVEEHSKRFARAAASSRRRRSAQVFPSFAMTLKEFEQKLEDWDWNPRQKRFMERYFVAAGISSSCPRRPIRTGGVVGGRGAVEG